MSGHSWTFIAVLFLWIGVSVFPTYADCPGPFTLEDQFARNQTVFVGRATAQRIVPVASSSGTYETETTFEAEELWKGEVNATFRVQTCGWIDGNVSAGCSEGLTFVVGSRYVIFAAGDPLRTGRCQPTALVDRAGRTLQFLSDKPRKKLANPALELAALGVR
jgi:hypothetical protein